MEEEQSMRMMASDQGIGSVGPVGPVGPCGEHKWRRH